MSSPTAIANKIAEIISTDPQLSAWVNFAFFGRTLTVKRGYYLVDDLRQEWHPAAIVVTRDRLFGDDNQTCQTTILVTCYVHQANLDPAVAETNLVDLVSKVGDIFDTGDNFRLGGLATTTIRRRETADNGSALPRLFRTVEFSVLHEI